MKGREGVAMVLIDLGCLPSEQLVQPQQLGQTWRIMAKLLQLSEVSDRATADREGADVQELQRNEHCVQAVHDLLLAHGSGRLVLG